MPPVGCHFNGGVNLSSPEEVFEAIGDRLRGKIRRIPDGEIDTVGQELEGAGSHPRKGSRQNWIWFLTDAYDSAFGIEELEPVDLFGDPFPSYGLTGDPEDILFPEGLGYADVYEDSYDRFLQARKDGKIESGVRFQAQFPTAAAVAFWLRPEDQQRALPIIAKVLEGEITNFIDWTDENDVAVQFDTAIEPGLIDGWYGEKIPVEVVADQLVVNLDAVNSRVPTGFHLCYGDYKHHHLGPVPSLELQVNLINALTARAHRTINWFSITVPQDETREEFFAPLANLRLQPETELYFGIVPYHPDQQEPGTTEKQIELIDRFVQSAHGLGRQDLEPVEWGVSTECGMARVESKDIPVLLGIYDKLASPIGG